MLYKGDWLAYDANIASQSGIHSGVHVHNLVRIEQDGIAVPQVVGASPCQMRASAGTAIYTYGLALVTPIYKGKPQVGKVDREFLFIKPGTFVVFDRVQTIGAGTRRVWSLNLPATPAVSGDTVSLVRGANRLDVMRLAPGGLTTQLVPWSGSISAGVRMDVADNVGDTSLFLNVLGVDGSVVQVVRSDGPGQTGAQILMTGGVAATVRFNNAGSGGSLEIRNTAGALLSSGMLPTTVQPLPLFIN